MPLIAAETKIVVFSDFDGTITFDDSNGMFYSLRTPVEILGRLYDR
jgi:2-hydroxy-3-keto-5-methylthiopentenyl-1-phosphate phosphatase